MQQRCTAYSTATGYQLKSIAQALQNKHQIVQFRDVIYVRFQETPEDTGLFIFAYGALVIWGLDPHQEAAVLELIKAYEVEPYDHPEKESLEYTYNTQPSVANDLITLASTDLEARLAFSHGLAQSVKLCVFEEKVRKTITLTKTIPQNLSKYGRISLSRKEIRKKMGELFIERSSINLHFDVLDVPEFFWENYELEPLYTIIAKYLDLETRVQVLNQRLDVIHDLYEVLANELNHQHSSFLEWIIIILIAIEVVASFVRELV